MSKYEHILYEVERQVATITWNRPDELNPMGTPLLDEFRHALRAADADDDVKVVVFRGAGRAFSAGGDFGEDLRRDPATGLPEGAEVGDYMLEQLAVMHDWYDDYLLLSDMRIPVIAQVHGWCLGGAAWITVAADLTIASDDAVFGQPEVRQGMPAGMIWALVAGWKTAMQYSLTGDHMDAWEALRVGLVNEVVKADELESRVGELARRIALLPRESIEINKRMIRRGMEEMGFRNALQMAADQSAWLWAAWRRSTHGAFERIAEEQGISAAIRHRDGPFWPERFGPQAKRERVNRDNEED
jgi:enoyl-CoA hydratase/carnithine racemase